LACVGDRVKMGVASILVLVLLKEKVGDWVRKKVFGKFSGVSERGRELGLAT